MDAATKEPLTFNFTAVTELWTGSVKPNDGSKLISTGLLGSIRWWLEVLVRGLGGSACDPSCSQCNGKEHCVVCELFGCTGWARKFRFQVLDSYGNIQAVNIKKDDLFGLKIIPLRPILKEEWTLLEATFRLISNYGAIGGKTVLKTQNYGLVTIEAMPELIRINRKEMNDYLALPHWKKIKHSSFEWASLKYFWCMQNYSFPDKKTFDNVLKSKLNKKGQWLSGARGTSKKVFSFINAEEKRTFGFIKPKEIGFQAIKDVLPEDCKKFLEGETIINKLFKNERN